MSAPIEYNTLEDLPPKPKRPLSGFFLYKREVFIQRRDEFSNLKITEITSKIAKEYTDLSQEHKQKYDDISKKDKENYLRLIAEWMEKYGEIERVLRDKLRQAEKELQKQEEENYSTSEANEIIGSMREEKKHLNERLEEALNTITKLRKMNDDLTQENQSLKRLSQMNEIVDPKDPTRKD